MISADKRLGGTFREIGVLNVLVKIINQLAFLCKFHPHLLSEPQDIVLSEEKIRIPKALFTNFSELTDLLVSLLENAQNQAIFKTGTNRSLYDCLQISNIQFEAIKVIRVRF